MTTIQFFDCDFATVTGSFTAAPVNFPTFNTASNPQIIFWGDILTGSCEKGFTPPVSLSLEQNTYVVNNDGEATNKWAVNIDGSGNLTSFSGSVLSGSTLLVFGTSQNNLQSVLANREVDIIPIFNNTLFTSNNTTSFVTTNRKTYYTDSTGSLSVTLVSPAIYQIIGYGAARETNFLAFVSSSSMTIEQAYTTTIDYVEPSFPNLLNQSGIAYTRAQTNQLIAGITASAANFASSSVSSSFATTASFAQQSNNAVSSSYAATASFALNAIPTVSASWASSSLSSSYAVTSSNASTASFMNGFLLAGSGPFTRIVTAQNGDGASVNVIEQTGVTLTDSAGAIQVSVSPLGAAIPKLTASGSLFGTASYAQTSSFALNAQPTVSASFASSSIYAQTASYVTSSYSIINNLTGQPGIPNNNGNDLIVQAGRGGDASPISGDGGNGGNLTILPGGFGNGQDASGSWGAIVIGSELADGGFEGAPVTIQTGPNQNLIIQAGMNGPAGQLYLQGGLNSDHYIFGGANSDIYISASRVHMGTAMVIGNNNASLTPVHPLDVIGAISASVVTASMFYGTASLSATASFVVSSSHAVTSSYAISSSHALASNTAITSAFANVSQTTLQYPDIFDNGSGFVGIVQSNPQYALDVEGQIGNSEFGNDNVLTLDDGTGNCSLTNNGGGCYIQCYNDGGIAANNNTGGSFFQAAGAGGSNRAEIGNFNAPSNGASGDRLSYHEDGTLWHNNVEIFDNQGHLAATGSLNGSASFAQRSLTASFALNAGSGGTTLTTGSTYPITASWSQQSVSSVSSSFASASISSSFAATSSALFGFGTPAVAQGYILTGSIWNTQTGNYNLQNSDNGKLVIINSSTHTFVTASSTLNQGFACSIMQQGTGQVTVVTGSGVTINNAQSLSSSYAQWATIVLFQWATSSFILQGQVG